MAEVTLQDGTVVSGVPEGTDPAEVQRRVDMWRSMPNPFESSKGYQGPNYSAPQSMAQGAASRLLGNVANTPDLVANLGARAVNLASGPLRTAANKIPGVDIPQPFNPPAFGQDYVPGPTGADLQGYVQRIGEGAAAVRTGNFDQFSQDPAQDQRELNQRMMEQNPGAFFMGQVGGDVMTLVTGRAPISRTRGLAQLDNAQTVRKLSETSRDISLAPSVAETLKITFKESPGLRTLYNRAGRATEAGLEGFALSALNGEADPVETMAYSAGLQAGGSLLLGGTTGLLSGGIGKIGAKLGGAAFSIGALMQMFNATTREGNDFLLDSMESGFSKVMLGLTAGAVSAAAGTGRVTSGFPVRLGPKVADMITSMPRAATISLMTEVMEDPAINSVVRKLSNSPDYFGSAATRRLERAYLNGNFKDEFESLMANEEFSKKFEAIK